MRAVLLKMVLPWLLLLEDPGRLPYRQLMKDARRDQRAAHGAELEAQARAARGERGDSTRGIRGMLRRVRDAVRPRR
jgi:hypothetical protein